MIQPAPWVALLTGPTGSGKSTFAARLAQRTGCLIASPDGLRLALFGGSYPNRQAWSRSQDVVYALCEDVVEIAVRDGYSVVVDGVNSTAAIRRRYLQHAPEDRSIVIGFHTEFDNLETWARRGYDVLSAHEFRALHRGQIEFPAIGEATYIRAIKDSKDVEKLLVDWPLETDSG